MQLGGWSGRSQMTCVNSLDPLLIGGGAGSSLGPPTCIVGTCGYLLCTFIYGCWGMLYTPTGSNKTVRD